MTTNKTTDAKHDTTADKGVNDFSKLPLLLGHDGKYDKPKAKTAFQKRSQPYNPAMINQFKLGIMTRDVEAVAEAIDHGVNPATMIGQTHPLMALMYDQTEGPVSQMTNMSFPHGMSSSEYFQETSKLVDLLLESGVKLLDNDSYRTKDCKYLVDHLLYSPHHDDLSNIVIHAIKEGLERNGRPYERDLVDYVGKYVENAKSQGGTDEVAAISIALRQYATVHEIVSNRIAEPSTPVEWDLNVRSANDHGTWGETLNLPSVRNFQQAEPSKTPTPAQIASKVKEIEKNQGGAPVAGAKIDDDIAPFITILQKRDPADVLADIMKATGNEKYKENVEAELLDRAFVAIRASHGLKDESKSLHMALTGSTGTGKTSLARLDAEYLYAIGFGGPYFAEVSRTKLMKGHIGATDVLINKLITTAHFIFVDEAPQLIQASQGRDDKQDFGHRVVEAVIPATENNRSWQVFYFAGYTKEMEAFLNSDKGFRGRISRHVHLEDPSKENLGHALDGLLKDRDLKINDDAKSYLLDKAMEEKEKLGDYFANYRAVRTIAENLRPIMARRLLGANKGQILGEGGTMQSIMLPPSVEDCMQVTMEDVKKLDFAEIMGSNSKKKAEAAANQNNNGGAEYQGTTMGFTGTLKKLATP